MFVFGKCHLFCSPFIITEHLIPVSYTHLDVYKRQVKKGKKTIGYAYNEQERDALTASIDGEATVKRFKGLGEMNSEDL